MANNIVDISLLNPIRFVGLGGGPYKGFDDDWFVNLLFDFQDQVTYSQKWQKSDVINLQFWSNFTPINIDVLDCSGKTVNSYSATKKTGNLAGTAFWPYEVSINLATLATGTYYLLLTIGTATNQTQLISEPLFVDDTIDNSILFTYSNTFNDQGVIWETGIEMTFRVEGIVTGLLPGFKDVIFQDQVLNNVLLSSIPFRQFKLMLGGERGVPDWVADKVNRILSCNTWAADGKSFVKKDGTQWSPVTLDNYPMSGWSIDILEAQVLSSKRGSNNGDPTEEISIVYNIDSALFGDFQNNVSNNIIQVNLKD